MEMGLAEAQNQRRSDRTVFIKTTRTWTLLFYDLRRDFEVFNRGRILLEVERHVDGLEHMKKV